MVAEHVLFGLKLFLMAIIPDESVYVRLARWKAAHPKGGQADPKGGQAEQKGGQAEQEGGQAHPKGEQAEQEAMVDAPHAWKGREIR